MLQSALVRLVAVEGALHLRVMSIKRVIIERAGVLNNKYINPPIDFIKPYWSEVETNIGFSETTISRKEATERFTERFRKSFGLAEDVLILPTGSGRTALELALKTLKKKFPTRTKVMIPTYGCKGTFDPIVRSGLIPVLVDIDRDLLMDFQKTKELLTTDTLACIPVHLCGKQMDTRPFFEQARKHGIVIIEDHCQFNGGEIYYPYGDFMPDLTIYSFGPGENIIATAGGALVSRILKDELRTESKQLREEEIGLAHHRFAYYYRSYFRREQAPTTDQTDIMAARTNPYEYAAMNSLDALILFEQLSKLNAIIDARRRNAYAVISQLQLFPHLYSIQSAGPHIYTKLSVILPNRDLLESFRTFLSKKRIELENMYIPLHLRDLGVPFEAGDLSASEDLYPLVVNIPVRPNLTKREVSRIKRAVKGFGKNNSVNLSSEELEKGNLDKYNSKFYHADSITVTPPADPTSYSDVLLQERLYLASEYAENAVALDLCCGTGEHLFYLAKNISEGIGFDYSKPFIEKANRTRALLGLTKVEFIQGNARRLPFGDGHFDLVYCFSSLQTIPNVGEVINEISRVLRPGGKCVLDMGNIYSLNTIVCNAYPEYAHPFHVSVACMKKMIYGSDFRILRHKAFQILPMWGDRPKWLKPLLLRGLTRLLGKRIRGKMLDEWISNLPVLKLFAFRHVFVCEKNGSRLTK
jgi:dTDP-4-amino-4,6-dideoxygalactose transaminase/SAM-dependent methyltransferase